MDSLAATVLTTALVGALLGLLIGAGLEIRSLHARLMYAWGKASALKEQLDRERGATLAIRDTAMARLRAGAQKQDELRELAAILWQLVPVAQPEPYAETLYDDAENNEYQVSGGFGV